MDESFSYLDPIGFEEERLRLWRLFHQYPRPRDYGYRMTVVCKIVALHGGYKKLPRMSERQKTIMEMYYEKNTNDEGIGFRLGIGALKSRKEREAALRLLEYPSVTDDDLSKRVVSIRAAKAVVRQVPVQAQQIKTQSRQPSFWDAYDAAHYSKQQSLAVEHLRDIDLDALTILSVEEHSVLAQSYKQHISIFEIAMRSGWSEQKVRALKKSGLQKVRESEVVVLQPVRDPVVIPDTAKCFWDMYDVELSWRKKRELLKLYLDAFPIDARVQLGSREQLILQELIVNGNDISSIAHANPQLKKQTIMRLFKVIIDALRVSDGVAPLYRKAAKKIKRKAAAPKQALKQRKRKEEYDGEKMMLAYLAEPTNRKLKDKLVLEWMPLVHYVVEHKVHTNFARFQYDDYISMGTVGLLEAIEKYDPNDARKATFKTYALGRITFAIQNGSKDELGWHNAFAHAEHIIAELKEIEKKEKSGPLDLETLERKGLLERRLNETQAVIQSDSLDRTVRYKSDGHSVCLGDLIPRRESTSEHAEMEFDLEALSRSWHVLSEREQTIVHMAFYEDMKSGAISKKLGMSPNGVLKRLGIALDKLKKAILCPEATQEDIDALRFENSEVYRSAFECLPLKHQEVLRARDEDGLTLEAAGRKIGLTRERVRQIEEKARRNIVINLGRAAH